MRELDMSARNLLMILALFGSFSACLVPPRPLESSEEGIPKDAVYVVDEDLIRGTAARAFVDKYPAFSGSRSLGGTGIVRVDQARAVQVENGSLRVEVVIRNQTDRDLVLEMRSFFLDAQGFLVEENPAAWRRVFLGARGTEVYREVSQHDTAAHYYVEVREH